MLLAGTPLSCPISVLIDPSSASQPAVNCGGRSLASTVSPQEQWSAAATAMTETSGTPHYNRPLLADRTMVKTYPSSGAIPDNHYQLVSAKGTLSGAIEGTVPVTAKDEIADSDPQYGSDQKMLYITLLRRCGLRTDTNYDHGYLSPGWFIKAAVDAFYPTITHSFPVQTPDRGQKLLEQFAQSNEGLWLHRMAAAMNLVAVADCLHSAGVDINHIYDSWDSYSPCCEIMRDTPFRAIRGDTPLIMAACNRHWNMVGILLESGAHIEQLEWGQEHLLHSLFESRVHGKIDDKTLIALTEIILKWYAGRRVVCCIDDWGKIVPLALYAFIQAALKGVDTQLNASILAQHPWFLKYLQMENLAARLVTTLIKGELDLPHTIQYLLDLQAPDGQTLIR